MDLNTIKDVATTVAAILASIKVVVDLIEEWKNASSPGKHRKR